MQVLDFHDHSRGNRLWLGETIFLKSLKMHL